MKNFDAFIFDIDGTLVSTNKLIFASFNHVTQKYLGKFYPDEEIIKLFGPPEEFILKKWMNSDYEAARKDYYNFYENNHDEMVKTFPGIYDSIHKLSADKIPLGIFTGKGRRCSIITLEKLGLLQYFDLLVTGDDVANYKPHPEGILTFIRQFNLEPERVLMIGDSPSDVKAAKKSGVKIAGVLWDSYAKTEVENLNCDYLFNTTDELSQFIEYQSN